MTAIRDTSTRRDAAMTRAMLGADGNERLTAWTGAALLLGFAVEGVTVLDVSGLKKWHIMLGLALLVPVALKVASTAYRFSRYYGGSPAYVRKGPPRPLLRVLGPFVILLTGALLLTGVGIMIFDGHRHKLEFLHKASFVLWFGVTTIHVLAYVWRLPRLMLADVAGRGTQRAPAVVRIALATGAGAAGLVLGVALLPWITHWVYG